jgi:predicted ATP-grasp superfamily ATP-dependent carboligase
MRVLVTDAHLKQTLGIVRSLGSKGIYIIAGAHKRRGEAFYSKYCREKIIYPVNSEEKFIEFILNYIKNNPIDILLPVGTFTTLALAKYQKLISQYTLLPLADWNAIEVASDKKKTLEIAQSLGVKTPIIYENPSQIERFPVVAKGIKGSGLIQYINSPSDFANIKMPEFILEEYIPGEGYGFFALFNHGKVRAIFMHKRLRELPITGGPSTAAESVYDPVLKNYGLRLLEALNWHGVAMVEFKKDIRDGEFKLMEINPRFWGSLDLAIASGVDFPYLLVKMAIEGDVEPVMQYKVGVKYMWPFPDDFLHTIANPYSVGAFIGDFFRREVKSNIWLKDIKPNLYQVMETIYALIFRVRQRKWRHPHGLPKIKR